MKRVLFAVFLSLLLAPLAGGIATAQTADGEALRRAEKMFRADRMRDFNAIAPKITNPAFAPLVRFWRAAMELRRNRDAAGREFVAAAADAAPPPSPFLQTAMRRRLLEFYADKKQWRDFAAVAPPPRSAGDGGGNAGDACAAVLGALLRRDAGQDAAVRRLWQKDIRFSDPLCIALYRIAQKTGALTDEDFWLKIRALGGARELSAARRLLRAFPGRIRYADLRAVANRATRYIRGKRRLRTRAQRELVMVAAMAAARRSPDTAIRRWRAFAPHFTAAENANVWLVLAEWAARWGRADALALYKRAVRGGGEKYASENSRAWHIRAALRAGDCAAVLRVTGEMPPAEREVSAWRYWRAVCLERGGRAETAAVAFANLAAATDDFYGLLAREKTGAKVETAPPPPPRPPDGDFALALSLYQNGLHKTARQMWRHAVKNPANGAAKLLAAAQGAQGAGWFLAGINAANAAATPAAHALRFPLPYRADIGKRSAQFLLDEAFVYGLIRQESRFMPRVVSSAGARGLMQVIPRTARLVARRHRYTRYHLSRLTRVDTNVIIGATYLADLAKRFAAAPAKVAAGYNAGPSRVRRWYGAAEDLPVAIENIPITETRLYVKYVLANRLHYSLRLGNPRPFTDSLTAPMRGKI